MTTTRIKVKRSNPVISSIVKSAHPDYRGRKVAIELVPLGYEIASDEADGGTFRAVALYVMGDGSSRRALGERCSVYAPGVFGLVVSWDHYQGADCGITIYLPAEPCVDVAVDAFLSDRCIDAQDAIGGNIRGGWGPTDRPQPRDIYLAAASARAEALRAAEAPKPESTKGRPTSLNVWALGKLANGRREFPNQIQPTSVPHIRRCMKAGLVEIASKGYGGLLRLTDAGVAAVNADASVPRVAA